MDSKIVGFFVVLAGLFWAWTIVKSWWLDRAVNKITEEDKQLIKEKLKHESKIEEVSNKLESIPTEQDGKTDAQIEDFWANRK